MFKSCENENWTKQETHNYVYLSYLSFCFNKYTYLKFIKCKILKNGEMLDPESHQDCEISMNSLSKSSLQLLL